MAGRLQVAALGFLLLAGIRAEAAQDNPSRASRASNSDLARLVVPAGAIVPLELNNTINSRTAYIGEIVYCESIYPVTDGDRMCIPAHSYVRGTLTEVVRPGRLKGKAQLSLRFDSLTLPDGTTRPIQAKVFSIAGSRISESKTGEESAEKPEGEDVATGGATDAVIDASGLGSASPLAAASQGVGGLVLMLVTRGKTIILRPGTTLEIQLTAPLELSAAQSPDKLKPPALQHRPADSRQRSSSSKPRQDAAHP
jgi:hypothetical protein